MSYIHQFFGKVFCDFCHLSSYLALSTYIYIYKRTHSCWIEAEPNFMSLKLLWVMIYRFSSIILPPFPSFSVLSFPSATFWLWTFWCLFAIARPPSLNNFWYHTYLYTLCVRICVCPNNINCRFLFFWNWLNEREQNRKLWKSFICFPLAL